jgi:hypothetical protein
MALVGAESDVFPRDGTADRGGGGGGGGGVCREMMGSRVAVAGRVWLGFLAAEGGLAIFPPTVGTRGSGAAIRPNQSLTIGNRSESLSGIDLYMHSNGKTPQSTIVC